MPAAFDPFALPQASPYDGEAHRAFQTTVRRFVAAEIEPNIDAWEDAGELPRDLHERAAAIGLIGLGFPERYGGVDGDVFMGLVSSQELARAGAGGVGASLMTHAIALPPIVAFGSDRMKDQVVPEVLAGRKIAALAITEPSGGSDVAAITTTARRDGDHFVVNGQKTFITSGMRADYYTVAVRTGGEGAGGISLLLLERDMDGFDRTPLKKMGWWSSDTATLYFDDVRVPVDNLIGGENLGFMAIMHNFNSERLGMAASANGFAKACFQEAAGYARERHTFGKPLLGHQVIRHKLADMAMRIQATQGYLEAVAWRVAQGDSPVVDICLLKNQATLTMEYCAREAVQILGGAGFMRGPKSERIYREVRVNAIGGGAEEIMRDLAVRQMGI